MYIIIAGNYKLISREFQDFRNQSTYNNQAILPFHLLYLVTFYQHPFTKWDLRIQPFLSIFLYPYHPLI